MNVIELDQRAAENSGYFHKYNSLKTEWPMMPRSSERRRLDWGRENNESYLF